MLYLVSKNEETNQRIENVPQKDIVTRKGNITGRRYFASEDSAGNGMRISDIKAALKEQGIKGKAATRRINELLRSGKKMNRLNAMAILDTLLDSHSFDYADVGKNASCIRLKRVSKEVTEKPKSVVLSELSDEDLAKELQKRQEAKEQSNAIEA